MTGIVFEGRSYHLHEHESVLAGLNRHGVPIPSSCRSGVCQTCLMRAVGGPPPAAAQKGLGAGLRERDYFLACCCTPTEDMEVALPGPAALPFHPATVIARTALNEQILRLRLSRPPGFDYRAGQFVNLRHGGVVRSYSLASVPDHDDYLELHVQRLAGGRMSGRLHDDCGIGETLELQGPLGECHYRPGQPAQPLLLIGTGSGLAPLWGIVRDALRRGHDGPIRLFHGTRRPADLYLVDELRALAAAYPQFDYAPCVSRAAGDALYAAGRAADLAFARHPALNGWRVFLCGNAAMVKAAKKRAFLAGAALADIHADPFEFSETAAPAATPSGV